MLFFFEAKKRTIEMVELVSEVQGRETKSSLQRMRVLSEGV